MTTPRDDGALFRDLHAAGPQAVAVRLGFTVLRSTTISPCPACKAEFRSSRGHDRRGPVGLTRDGLGWKCHRCGAHGDAATFAAYAVTGTDRPAEWRAVLEALERVGIGGEAPPPPRVTPTRKPDARPPRPEVLELWARCRPVVDDAACAAWLESRGLDPWCVADRDLARALPAGLTVPRWARMHGRPWNAGGYRCVLPFWNARGELTSLHARNLDRAADPKGVMPTGYAVAGLVLADAPGCELLAHRALAGPLWVTEGAPDFLVTAIAWGDAAEESPATLGIVSGSWAAEIAARVPDRARVIVAVHHDDAGEKYVQRIVETLRGRVTLERWVPNGWEASA